MPPQLKPSQLLLLLLLLAAGIAMLTFVGPPVCPPPGCTSVEDMHIQESGAQMYRLMMPIFVGIALIITLGFLARRP